MKILHLLFVGFLVSGLVAADPITKPEPKSLRLIASMGYVILSPASPEGQPTPPRAYRRQIQVYLENIGNKSITVPTNPDHIGGSSGLGQRDAFYGFHTNELNKRPIIVSPFKYQPVTLAPGEITELPIYIDRKTITDVAAEKIIQDTVTYYVSEDLAKRHGWWSGTLSVPVSSE